MTRSRLGLYNLGEGRGAGEGRRLQSSSGFKRSKGQRRWEIQKSLCNLKLAWRKPCPLKSTQTSRLPKEDILAMRRSRRSMGPTPPVTWETEAREGVSSSPLPHDTLSMPPAEYLPHHTTISSSQAPYQVFIPFESCLCKASPSRARPPLQSSLCTASK